MKKEICLLLIIISFSQNLIPITNLKKKIKNLTSYLKINSLTCY